MHVLWDTDWESRMPCFVSGKVKLHLKKKSCGYPIIVLDEFGSESCAWDLNVRHFACHHRCITHNARELPPSDVLKVLASYGREFFVEDVAFMRGLVIPRAHLVGCSMAGYAALQFCLRYPERASALVVTRTWIRLLSIGTPRRDKKSGCAREQV